MKKQNQTCTTSLDGEIKKNFWEIWGNENDVHEAPLNTYLLVWSPVKGGEAISPKGRRISCQN